MAIPITTSDDLLTQLRSLGVVAGDRLVVHARLISFGQIEGGAATVFAALMEAIGPQGTLVVPTYTLARGPTRFQGLAAALTEFGEMRRPCLLYTSPSPRD